MVNSWTCPEANNHGFVPWHRLVKQVAGLSLDRFLHDYPVPALRVLDPHLDPAEPGEPDPADRGIQLLTETIESAAILQYLTKVAFVTKKPGNPFPHLVSIGRSHRNDITIAVDSVSRVHGYFVCDDGRWCFTDHGSSNGSQIDGCKMQPAEKYPLNDGQQLQLGLDVILELLYPRSLYHKIEAHS